MSSLVYCSNYKRNAIIECLENYDSYCAKKGCNNCKRRIWDMKLFIKIAYDYFERK